MHVHERERESVCLCVCVCVCVCKRGRIVKTVFNILYSMPIPVILQINCGYSRAAIRELSSPEELKSRKEIAFERCRQKLLSLFSSVTTYSIPEEYQISGNRNFNNTCEKILDNFKKWHPSSKRLEYLSCFSTESWKHLASCEKDKHTLAFCVACMHVIMITMNYNIAFPVNPCISHLTLSSRSQIHNVLSQRKKN